METLLRIMFFAVTIFSIGYGAAVRIMDLREERRMLAGPQEPARPQKISKINLFRQWAINLF
jgi:hypothetical protein